MGWETAANVATTVGTVGALIGVGVSLYFNLRSDILTRQGQELERDQAEATAARSEAAARLTEDYARRVVDALEAMAKEPPVGFPAPKPTRVGVRWALTHHSGDGYQLENVGEVAAKAVAVSAHESLVLRTPAVQDIEPHTAVTFVASRRLGTSDSTITVEWGEDGARESWRYPLPPRPKRT